MMKSMIKTACFMGIAAGLSFGQDVRTHLLSVAPDSPSEALPYGVPGNWSWVVGADLNGLTHDAPYTHANFWGAIFRGQTNTTPANTEIQIANTQMWVLRNGQSQWELIQGQTPPDLGGGTFSPTYSGGGPDPILRHTSEGSFVVPAPGYIWHFWYGNSFQPVSNDLRGMIVNARTRLVLKNASGTDDRSQADYLIHMGADLRNPNDPSCANDGYICPSFGVGKMMKITSEWRNVTFSSVTKAELDAGMPLPPASIFGSIPQSSSSVSSSSIATSSSSSVPAHVGPWKIQAIGNSITQGDGEGGYRCKLKALLTAEGIETDFVGTSTGGSCSDNQHDGHGGYTIGPGASKADEWDPNGAGNIYDNIDAKGNYLQVNPEVILLQIGTNEWFNVTTAGYDPNVSAAPKLKALVEKILAAKPNVILFIASVTKANWDANLFNALNSSIPQLVTDKKALGFNVHYVNMSDESNFVAEDYADALHPNGAGYSKMAEVWLNHLKPVLTGSVPSSSSSSQPNSSSSATMVSVGTVLEAETANLATGNGLKTSGVVAYNDVGEYFYFPQLKIATNVAAVDLTYAVPAPYNGHKVELRLGSTTGTLLATHVLQSTANWETMRTDEIKFTPWTGTQDLYVVFAQGTGSNTWVGDFDKLTFKGAQNPTAILERPHVLGISKIKTGYDLLGRKSVLK